MENNTEARAAQLETVLDGAEHTLVFADAREETVRIRKIPIRHLSRLGLVWGNEPAEVALYCDKSAAWVDQLTDASFELAVEEGRRLNFTSFEKWFKRQGQVLQAMGQMPAIEKVIKEAMDTINPGSPPSSTSSSPAGTGSKT